MRIWMLISVALNLLLLANMVAARVDQSHPEFMPAGVSEPGEHAAGAQADIRDIDNLSSELHAAGFGDTGIKSLLLGWLLVAGPDEQAAEGEVHYWQPGYAPTASSQVRRIHREQRARDALLALYGPAARTDPAFAAVFRPLDPALGFLSPEAQLSLQQYQLEQMNAGVPSGRSGTAQARTCVGPTPAAVAAANGTSELAIRIGDADFGEYLIRLSPLAERLRESGAVEDEADFRESYRLLRSLEQQASPAAQADTREQLRSLLGTAGFDRFWSSQDPFFKPVAEFLLPRGFSEAQVQAAYSVINRTQDELLELMSRQPDQQTMLGTVNRIKQSETLHLNRLLGDQVAAGLAAATTQSAMRFAAEGSQNC